jgi:hypothetical protein
MAHPLCKYCAKIVIGTQPFAIEHHERLEDLESCLCPTCQVFHASIKQYSSNVNGHLRDKKVYLGIVLNAPPPNNLAQIAWRPLTLERDASDYINIVVNTSTSSKELSDWQLVCWHPGSAMIGRSSIFAAFGKSTPHVSASITSADWGDVVSRLARRKRAPWKKH